VVDGDKKVKDTKKITITFGVIAITLLLVSTVTAVEQQTSETIMNIKESNEDFASTSPEELLELLDLDGFKEFFTSAEFAELMKSDFGQTIFASEEFNNVLNTYYMNEFLNSDIFQEFVNSEEAGIFLENYYGNNEFTDIIIFLLGALISGLILWTFGTLLYLIGGPIMAFRVAFQTFVETGDIFKATQIYLYITFIFIGLAIFWPLVMLIAYLTSGSESYSSMPTSAISTLPSKSVTITPASN
jgi:hypothetical protein